jgi:hypothetical protein
VLDKIEKHKFNSSRREACYLPSAIASHKNKMMVQSPHASSPLQWQQSSSHPPYCASAIKNDGSNLGTTHNSIFEKHTETYLALV